MADLRLFLFTSSSSRACGELNTRLSSMGVRIPTVRLDTPEARARVSGTIDEVPTLIVYTTNGPMKYEGISRVIKFVESLGRRAQNPSMDEWKEEEEEESEEEELDRRPPKKSIRDERESDRRRPGDVVRGGRIRTKKPRDEEEDSEEEEEPRRPPPRKTVRFAEPKGRARDDELGDRQATKSRGRKSRTSARPRVSEAVQPRASEDQPEDEYSEDEYSGDVEIMTPPPKPKSPKEEATERLRGLQLGASTPRNNTQSIMQQAKAMEAERSAMVGDN